MSKACPCAKVRACSRTKFDSCLFNAILAFIDSTFLVIVFMGIINLEKYNENFVEKNGSYWCALVGLTICALEIICVPIFMIRNRRTLDKEQNLKRCGYIYEDLNHRIRGGWALAYPIIY